MKSIPKVAVIIVNFNGEEDTAECIDSLLEGNNASFELCIYVVDNASEKKDLNSLRLYIEKQKNCELIKSSINLGFSGGNNIGIGKALSKNADYIFLLNNDTTVAHNTISDLLKPMTEDVNIGIAGPKIYFAHGFEYHKERYNKKEVGRVIWYGGGLIDWDNVILSHRGVDEVDAGQFDEHGETGFVSGCAMMVKSDVFKKAGVFDGNYFLYLEDADLCMRAKKAGFKVFYEPASFLWHKNAASSGKPGSDLHVYYQTRNRLYFGMKYAGLRTKLALLKEAIRNARKNAIAKKAMFDFLTFKMGMGKIST